MWLETVWLNKVNLFNPGKILLLNERFVFSKPIFALKEIMRYIY